MSTSQTRTRSACPNATRLPSAVMSTETIGRRFAAAVPSSTLAFAAATSAESSFAPESIQSFRSPSSSGVIALFSDLLAGGMMGSTRCEAIWNSRLSSAFPGTSAGPLRPPLIMFPTLSMRNWLRGETSLWHPTHLPSRMSTTSVP